MNNDGHRGPGGRHEQHGPHHHHGHHGHHDHGPRDQGPGGGPQGGPPATGFLDLELSKVIMSRADMLAREAGDELLREAIKARLRERLGEHIDALGRLAADAFIDDITASLTVEHTIEERKAQRGTLEARFRELAMKMRGGGDKGGDG